jgi:hypothetical protein
VNAATLPAARHGDPTLGELRILDTQPADHAVVLLCPDTGELIGLNTGDARALAADLERRADHIDPQGAA